MRVATYARFSSDLQSAASITDQQRICHEFAVRQKWMVVADYHDAAMSGASMQRPGLQMMLRAAQAHAFDAVLTESLDRVSRDIEDTAGLFKRLKFAGVRVVTVSEGEITALHIGFKGTMNQQYIDDLREKTHRGLRGRVEAGKSGGGRCYGYRVVPGQAGDREIDPVEADVVRRIFRQYVEGVAPKAIAKRLNREGIPGPRGKGKPAAWSPSTIHGHARRGTGILNNEAYVGRLVWNRQMFIKDPDTGRRQARPNPPDQVITVEAPHLRVIDDAVWQETKARQSAVRLSMSKAIVGGRRPKHLFSGLTVCDTCGGKFTTSSHDRLTCFNAHTRGVCSNRRTIKRTEVEVRVLGAMQTKFLEPGLFATFCEGFTAELERLRRGHLAQMSDARRELAHVERAIHTLIDALKNGIPALTVKDELIALETRKATLTAAIAEPVMREIHPHMADVFRRKATTLATSLEDEDKRDGARESLRGFLDQIVIPPGDELLTVRGNFYGMLAAAQGKGLASAVGINGCGGGI